MNAQVVPSIAAQHETENDRFKRSFGSWFWGSMIAATVIHFAVFQFWPTLTAEDVSFSSDELETIELPPEIKIPPPPKRIARPAVPVVATADIEEDITIAPTTFEDNPVEDLPPPPSERENDISSAPVFTPMTVRPEIKNRGEVIRAMEREYPAILRDAGIGGRVAVWFFIDEDGTVRDTRISQTSGHAGLDDAAIKVADVYRFTPALNRDKKVQVWVQFTITFEVR
ncbi:MAG: TonB family protein [Longimicrobiales bacterium]